MVHRFTQRLLRESFVGSKYSTWTDTVMGISPQLCTNVELFSYLNGASSPLRA